MLRFLKNLRKGFVILNDENIMNKPQVNLPYTMCIAVNVAEHIFVFIKHKKCISFFFLILLTKTTFVV